MNILLYMLGGIIGYLLGSVPFALVIGKLVKGIDVRDYGSGNLGGTNVARTLGNQWGILVIVCDMLKGVCAAGIGFLLGGPLLGLIGGLLAIIGHMYPVFAKFKGGKGVATGAGVFMFLAPIPVGIALIVFAIVLFLTRYVSLASIIAATVGAVVVLLPWIEVYFLVRIIGVFVAIFIIYKHKSNIKKLLNGTENKIGRNKK